MDINIGLLQYIKSGEISVENAISNVKAGQDINIRIKQFFMNSPDYQKLFSEIDRKKTQLENETNEMKRLHFSQELNNLAKLEKEFQVDVLRLADVFSKLEIKTERLQRSSNLFDQGNFKEADAMLGESDLSNDQFNLLIQADYLEQRIGILKQLIN